MSTEKKRKRGVGGGRKPQGTAKAKTQSYRIDPEIDKICKELGKVFNTSQSVIVEAAVYFITKLPNEKIQELINTFKYDFFVKKADSYQAYVRMIKQTENI